MTALIGRCGYRCDLCPAYRENIRTPRDQQRASDGWFKYYGFRIPPEAIQCDGCLDMRPDAKRIDCDCKVRSCTLERGFDTCAECEQYPCELLKEKIVCRQWVENRAGGSLPEEDYETFVMPYESNKVLDRMREEGASS